MDTPRLLTLYPIFSLYISVFQVGNYATFIFSFLFDLIIIFTFSFQYDVIIQAIKKQFKWTRNWKNDKILSIIKENRPSDDSPGTCNVTFIHTLNCSRENQPASSSDESTGALGYFTKEEAVKCLKAAPLLENLATWSCWDVVFEPEFGDLKSFIADCDDLHAIETATNNLLRISLDSTVDDLGKAIIAEEPQDAAGHLLSIILSNGGLDRSPIIHIANVMKTSLTMLMAPERGSSSLAIEKFVLDCMMHIPIHFCSSIFTKVRKTLQIGACLILIHLSIYALTRQNSKWSIYLF